MINIPVAFSGYSIFDGDVRQISLKNKFVLNTINQFSYTIAEKDAAFKKALQESDILLPDGVGITLAVRLLNRKVIHKIAGNDIHQHLLQKLNETGGRCFYLGSSETTLKLIQIRIAREFPNITVGSFSPPFKKNFSDQDNNHMIKAINRFKPDVLFVGMTAPKQEKWIYEHKNAIHSNIICAIGAVFDFYAGTVLRPSKYWRSMGMEWLGRLINEPRRMYKRYLYYGPIFLMKLLKLKFYDRAST
ncbi:WecB/TagA/CpsF family glycosyltransferase [Mucilaginibacter lutimaris]|uniref:WecB/TagA/CpsF family glycosyltransferase n=1 Tax=Mucilaginibacter lutimaris TaxID=931629 RepID=A0ABW2ZL80_9SPHI